MQRFTATVTGTANSQVTWSNADNLVSSDGTFSAPASIAADRTTYVAAKSVADPARTGACYIFLRTPASAISFLSPANGATVDGVVNLRAGTVANVSDVVFSVNDVPLNAPPAGGACVLLPTLGCSVKQTWDTAGLPGGTYRIKASGTTNMGLKVERTITVTVRPPVTSQITLPVEMIGPEGFTREVKAQVAQVSGNVRLYLRTHGLSYEGQGSVQVNNSAWIPISESTVTLGGLAAKMGGIGGGFHTLDMTVPIPANTVVSGTNAFRFRFDKTNGTSIGYRVLAFNLTNDAGENLIPATTFIDEDPSKWTPPSTLPSDIENGRVLFQTGALTAPFVGPIKAHCGNCHTYSGRDLKYFNFSSNAIRTSAIAHGLTAAQGDQIASYIRSLPYPSPGRPWNPPYQPGPGMDAKPVSEWAAGAGLQAVTASDKQTMDAILPGGSFANLSPTANLNAREIPIVLQLPDWAHWLPTINPVDSWPTFQNSELVKRFDTIRSRLKPDDPVAYASMIENFRFLYLDWDQFKGSLNMPRDSFAWTPRQIEQIYSLAQWKLVRLWELNQEFRLEAMPKAVFGPQADNRAWYGGWPFFVSPNMQQLPSGKPGLRNGRPMTHTYLSFIWYHLQLILNNSNKKQEGTSPIDWPYTHQVVHKLTRDSGTPVAGLQILWLVKGMQIIENGKGPEYGTAGWAPQIFDPTPLVHWDWDPMWKDTSAATRLEIINRLFGHWITRARSFTPSQFYAGGWASPTQRPIPGSIETLVDKMYYVLPLLKYNGVNSDSVNSGFSWVRTVWPGAKSDWDKASRATCAQVMIGGKFPGIQCSTELP